MQIDHSEFSTDKDRLSFRGSYELKPSSDTFHSIMKMLNMPSKHRLLLCPFPTFWESFFSFDFFVCLKRNHLCVPNGRFVNRIMAFFKSFALLQTSIDRRSRDSNASKKEKLARD